MTWHLLDSPDLSRRRRVPESIGGAIASHGAFGGKRNYLVKEMMPLFFFDLVTKAPAEGKVLVAEWHQFKDGKISHVRSAFDGRPYATMFTGAASR